MTFDRGMKWLYSFILLGATIGWGWFTMNKILFALEKKLDTDILVAIASTGLLTSLMTWDTIIVQHWFRKKLEEPPSGGNYDG